MYYHTWKILSSRVGGRRERTRQRQEFLLWRAVGLEVEIVPLHEGWDRSPCPMAQWWQVCSLALFLLLAKG